MSDLGIATIRPSILQQMTCIGTPIYMAPQVLKKEVYNESADLYSYGVFLVELYKGDHPYSRLIAQMPEFEVISDRFFVLLFIKLIGPVLIFS